MKNIVRRNMSMNRQSTTPISVPRSLRGHEVSTLTSMPAGRMVPIAAMPLLREDSVRRGQIRCSFEMHETAEILMNAVHCSVKAYLVPYLAFDRFSGMDDLNKSYMGVPLREGEEPVDFFETEVRGDVGTNPILERMGLHAKPTDNVNTAYVEAYNQIWNYRATNRSLNIDHRERLDKTLAPAFWKHDRYKHIVPDFDQALIDGEVALNIAEARIPVKGIGTAATNKGTFPNVYETGETSAKTITGWSTYSAYMQMEEDPDNPGFPAVFAELAENGITVSLSNIEAAKKTAAFAKLREQYNGLEDDHIIDMLMSGLTVPEQAYKQPMLLSSQSTIFGLSKRYASDGANLTESVVNGATFVDLNIVLPRITTGGVIMVVAECVPDQLFERQQDPLLFTSEVSQLPDFLRDELDPEKVDVVKCAYVDVDHDTPDTVFGYEPLNAKWDIKARRVGGRFLRPEVDASFDEDRQRIWACEVQNPTLTEDFYLSDEIHTKPFADQNQDPFEVVAVGQLVIEGNTVFGAALIEASDNYEQVLSHKPTEAIEK
nr:hypothetical protein [uncultured Cohaesibacter sp.]